MKNILDSENPTSNNDNEISTPINIEIISPPVIAVEAPDPFYELTDHEIWIESLSKKPFSELLLYEQSFLERCAEVDKKYGTFQLTTSPKKYTHADLANHSDKVLKLLENYKDLKMLSTNRHANDFIDILLIANHDYQDSDNPTHAIERQKFISKIKEIVADEQNIPLLESWGAKKEDIDLLRGDKTAIKAMVQNHKEGNLFLLGEKLRTLEFSLELHKNGETIQSGEYWQFISGLKLVVPHKPKLIDLYFYNIQTYSYINKEVENNNVLLLINKSGHKAWDSKYVYNNYFKPAENSFKYISVLGDGRKFLDNYYIKNFLNENIITYDKSNIIFISLKMHGAEDGSNFAEIVENLPIKNNKEGIVIYFFGSCHSQYYHDYLIKNPKVIEDNTLYITPAPYNEPSYTGDFNAEYLFNQLNVNSDTPLKTILEYFKDYKSSSETETNKVYITGIIQGKTYHNTDVREIYDDFDVRAEKITSAQKQYVYDPKSALIELEETVMYNGSDVFVSYQLDNGCSGSFNSQYTSMKDFLKNTNHTGHIKVYSSPENEKHYMLNNGVITDELVPTQIIPNQISNEQPHSKGFWKYLKHLCCVSSNEREAEESHEVLEATLETAALLSPSDITGESLNCNDI